MFESGGTATLCTPLVTALRSFEKVSIREVEDKTNCHITEILFDQMQRSKTLRNIKDLSFNVFDVESIKYENIKFCNNLEYVTITYFDHISPSFIQIFTNLIEILFDMYNRKPFMLSIVKVFVNNIPTIDSAFVDM